MGVTHNDLIKWPLNTESVQSFGHGQKRWSCRRKKSPSAPESPRLLRISYHFCGWREVSRSSGKRWWLWNCIESGMVHRVMAYPTRPDPFWRGFIGTALALTCLLSVFLNLALMAPPRPLDVVPATN